jgi:hypothetical protein
MKISNVKGGVYPGLANVFEVALMIGMDYSGRLNGIPLQRSPLVV